MRAPRPAIFPPAIRSGLPAGLLLVAAVAWAQGVKIPDPRDPAQYREPARASSCRVCGEIRSIREIRIQPNRAAMQNPTNQMVFGAVVLLPFGAPGEREDPYVGGVGTQEMAERMGNSTYEITIRMDNGEQQVLQRRDGGGFRVGERVTVSGGIMARL